MSDATYNANDFDRAVRTSWVDRIAPVFKGRFREMAVADRFSVYSQLDNMIKARYVELLKAANAELEVVHVKGIGQTRRSTNMVDLDHMLGLAATHVLTDSGFMEV